MFVCRPERRLPRAERAVVDALALTPGLALCGVLAESRKRTRELDVLLLRPSGIAVVEVKGSGMVGDLVTALNGEWTIGGMVADFAGGPNPIHQARTAAAAASGHLSRGGDRRVFVDAIVAVAGDVTVAPHRVGDVWVCRVDQVPAVLPALAAHPVDVGGAVAAAAAFGVDVDVDTCTVEQFPDQVPAEGDRPAAASRADTRRRRMEAVALRMWRASHRRLTLMSVPAAAASVYAGTQLTWPGVAAGVAAVCGVASWQLWRRGRLPGVRMTGPAAVAAWTVSLVPYGGAGAAAITPWLSGAPALTDGLWLVRFNACTLFALALLLVTRAGRCGFVYPPPGVAERLTADGRPSGTYVLVPADTTPGMPIGLLDPLDPRATILGEPPHH